MSRGLTVCALVLALPLVCRADDKAEPTETLIRLKVQPAAAPKPALRYQLLPEMRDLKPGNAAQAYLMCFMEQNQFFFNKESAENREKWATMPLRELPLKEIRHAAYTRASPALRQADYAARLDTVDWQILVKLKRDPIKLLIPEVQQLRTLAVALKVRFRAEVAEGRLDDALVSAQTMFALARHLEDHPTLISDLVGIAIAFQAIGPLEEMLQQPGCPNLFWALTDLPKPLVSLRKGAQTERMLLENVFDAIDDKAPMNEAQLKTAVDRIRELVKDINGPPLGQEHVDKWLAAEAKEETTKTAAARKRLVEFGLAVDKVKAFPAMQVLLLDDRLAAEMWRDDGLKALSLPYWQAEALLVGRKPPRGGEESLFIGLTGGFTKVRQAQARLEQRFALLCCVEALRIYAAEHSGKLPAQLADVKLPLPVDPVTGKPFVYKLDGGTATVRGTPPSGQEQTAAYNVRYEVTIAK